MLYPPTRQTETVHEYFGHKVPDPYSWLEDDRSPDTGAWVSEQNKVTFGYLEKITFRNELKDRLTKLWNYPKMGLPFKEGAEFYVWKNDGLQNQNVLYRSRSKSADKDIDLESDTWELFLDPNTLSDDGTTSIALTSFTKDGSLCAYAISKAGSDWMSIRVIDTQTRTEIGKEIENVKFSNVSWRRNEGFYYSSYDQPDGSKLTARTDTHKLYFHQLGTPQSEDQVIFGSTETEQHRYVGGYVSEDERFLIVSAANTTYGNKLFYCSLNSGADSHNLVCLSDRETEQSVVIDNTEESFLILTDRDAPNQRLVEVMVSAGNGNGNDTGDGVTNVNEWRTVIPERDYPLEVTTAGGFLFAHWTVDVLPVIEQYRWDPGNDIPSQAKQDTSAPSSSSVELVRTITLPGVGDVSGFEGKKGDTEVFFRFTNYHTPPSIYRYDLQSGNSILFWEPKTCFQPQEYESHQVFYQSFDGTKVPMIITHRKGIKNEGTNPTLLYGYGGFNHTLAPAFSISQALWLELGGVLAVPNIRGGGEYGKKWHDAGTKMKKKSQSLSVMPI